MQCVCVCACVCVCVCVCVYARVCVRTQKADENGSDGLDIDEFKSAFGEILGQGKSDQQVRVCVRACVHTHLCVRMCVVTSLPCPVCSRWLSCS